MPRTFYTIDDLVTFCRQNNYTRFSSKEHGDKPLIIQSVETFEVANNSQDGLMPVKLKSCHIGVNRNQSCISEEVMKENMSSFKGRPILANIIKTDTGEYEFHSHDVEFSDDGEMKYLECPVGVISQLDDPYLEYDKEEDKTYLHVNGHIFTEYSRAAEILERRRTCKCSIEIAVNDMSWNGEENYLSIDSFTFMGVTILGYEQDGVTEIQEGMKGSKITIDSFSADNSMFGVNYQEKLINTLEKLNVVLEGFNNKLNNSEEGGNTEMGDVENIVVEEELETSTEEVVAEEVESTEETHSEEETIVEETSTSEDGDENQEEFEEVPAEEKFTKNFAVELSHGDIQYALYNLIAQFDEEDNEYFYIRDVYDNYFIMQGWCHNKLYKMSYTVDGENVALEGDRQEMFELIVSESEKMAIEKMREDYSALEIKYNELKAFKDNYDASVLKADKEVILSSVEYAEIAESDEFKTLVSEMDKYSVDELKIKADLLFAASMKKKFSFEAKPEKKSSVGVNFSAMPDKKKQAYAGLFDE